MSDDFLNEQRRAEDILLGGLGFGEEASIIHIEVGPDGLFQGVGEFADGERFQFAAEDELSDLEQWALNVLLKLETKVA